MSVISRDHFATMFNALVQQGNCTVIPHYFAPDATMNLNGKEMTYADFEKRVQWMANKTLTVNFVDALIADDRAACMHFTTVKEDHQISRFKVFSRMNLCEGKITRFEHMTLRIEGDLPDSFVNDF